MRAFLKFVIVRSEQKGAEGNNCEGNTCDNVCCGITFDLKGIEQVSFNESKAKIATSFELLGKDLRVGHCHIQREVLRHVSLTVHWRLVEPLTCDWSDLDADHVLLHVVDVPDLRCHNLYLQRCHCDARLSIRIECSCCRKRLSSLLCNCWNPVSCKVNIWISEDGNEFEPVEELREDLVVCALGRWLAELLEGSIVVESNMAARLRLLAKVNSLASTTCLTFSKAFTLGIGTLNVGAEDIDFLWFCRGSFFSDDQWLI